MFDGHYNHLFSTTSILQNIVDVNIKSTFFSK
nr:MAG TPA: hypothetical protein [Caudoviricetes sp.]DAK59669.1 MAG TPA: hypothetical protein [Caudoviricetes sp.]